jgi:hypothetical protein
LQDAERDLRALGKQQSGGKQDGQDEYQRFHIIKI